MGTCQERLRIGSQARRTKSITNTSQVEARDDIVGYAGHVPGVIAENMYAKSFGKNTAKALNGEFTRGQDVAPKERFRSQSCS